MMKVCIPGIAYGAIKDSGFATQYPGLWQRMSDYSIELSHGRGLNVHVELHEDDWEALRACVTLLIRKLVVQPYQTRRLEGNVIMQQLQISLDRIDTALMQRIE